MCYYEDYRKEPMSFLKTLKWHVWSTLEEITSDSYVFAVAPLSVGIASFMGKLERLGLCTCQASVTPLSHTPTSGVFAAGGFCLFNLYFCEFSFITHFPSFVPSLSFLTRGYLTGQFTRAPLTQQSLDAVGIPIFSLF